ncbi:Ger(x)C family spore germination protein, partial [Effusibacillus consociatus]
MKKKLILLLSMILMTLLSGCWSRVEVNDIAIVTAIAIDKVEEGKIRMSLQVAIPMALGAAGGGGGSGGGEGEKKTTLLVSEEGETVMDAYRRLQVKLPRRITFAHSRILLIGEKAARSGVSPILDFFSRQRESRMRKWILVTEGDASEILKIKPGLERVSAEVIREEENQPVGLRVNLRDFSDMLLTDGLEPVAPQIRQKPHDVKKKDSESEESSKENMTAAILGAAVFHKDKLVGWMNDKETRGVLWLRDEMKIGVVTINIPEEKGEGKVSAQVLKASTKIIPTLENGRVKIEVDVSADYDIYENASKLDLSDPRLRQSVDVQTATSPIRTREAAVV